MVKSCRDVNFTSTNINVSTKFVVYLHMHSPTLSVTKDIPLNLFNNSTNSSAICKYPILKFCYQSI